MPLKDWLPLMRFVGTLVCPVLYIVSFASKDWVKTDTIQWGLWAWCYTNFTDQDDPSVYVNDTSRCHGLPPGDSPGYYEAVRTIACFTLVAFAANYFTFNENEGLGKDKKPVGVSFIAALLAAITVGTLGDHYDDDERWKDSDPSLGWCFWLAVASGCWSFIMCFVNSAHVDYKRVGQAKPQTEVSRPTPPAERRPSVTRSESSISSNLEIHEPGPVSTNDSDRRTTDQASRQRSGNAELPILDLPAYDLPTVPPSRSHYAVQPPPSYEEVMRGGYTPPPPYQPPRYGI